MNKVRVAKQLIKIAKELVSASKVSLEQIADIVRKHNGKIVSCVGDFERLCGRNNVSLIDNDMLPAMGYRIDRKVTEKGKDIIVISKKACTPDSNDIVVGDIVIGYM